MTAFGSSLKTLSRTPILWLGLACGMFLLGLACGGGPGPTATPVPPPTAASRPAPTATPSVALPELAATVAPPAPTATVVSPAATATVAPAEPTPSPAAAVSEPTLVPPTVTPTPAGPVETIVTMEEGTRGRYRVRERLAGRDFPNDAVGETPDASGSIVFNAEGVIQPDRSRLTVNVQTLRSDQDRRDRYIRGNSLETNRFPTVEFVVRAAPGLPWPLPRDGEVTFDLLGDLTVHGVTRTMRWEATALFTSDGVTGLAQTNFTFGEFEMEVPSAFIVLSVEDDVRLELDFVASISRDG